MFNKKLPVNHNDADFPFDKLDKSSKTLRDVGKDFADLLSSSKSATPELKSLITAVTKISSGKIEKMDEAFTNFKEALEKLSRKAKDKHAFSSSFSDKELPPILEKYADFIKEMVALAEQADKLGS